MVNGWLVLVNYGPGVTCLKLSGSPRKSTPEIKECLIGLEGGNVTWRSNGTVRMCGDGWEDFLLKLVLCNLLLSRVPGFHCRYCCSMPWFLPPSWKRFRRGLQYNMGLSWRYPQPKWFQKTGHPVAKGWSNPLVGKLLFFLCQRLIF